MDGNSMDSLWYSVKKLICPSLVLTQASFNFGE